MRSRLSAAAIVLLGLVVYARTLSFDFTYFVDDYVLDHHAFLAQPANMLHAFLEPCFVVYYRPLLTLSYMLDARLGGIAPFVYHLQNVVLHLIVSWLVFRLLVELEYGRGVALACALLFTAHPLATQAVAWIPGRNDSLLALFLLAAFLVLLRWSRTGRAALLPAHVLLFALALFTKETALVLPVVCACFLFFVAQDRPSLRHAGLLASGWLLVVIVWFAARARALPEVFEPGTMSHLFRNLPAALELAGKVVVPVKLSAFGIFSTFSTALGAVVVAACAGALVVVGRRMRAPRVVFSVLWFACFLLPTLAVRFEPIDYFEHRAYVPLVGVAVLLAELLRSRGEHVPGAVVAAIAGVLVVFSLLTIAHERHFEGAIPFYAHALQACPRCDSAAYALGTAYDRAGDLRRARAAYEHAVALDPAKTYYHNDLGMVYAKEGRTKEAERELEAALKLDPANPFAYYNLGLLHFQMGELDEAERLWKQTLEVEPGFTDAYDGLIQLLEREQRHDEARSYAERLERLPADRRFATSSPAPGRN